MSINIHRYQHLNRKRILTEGKGGDLENLKNETCYGKIS